ncbi:MAG: PEP-CTERM sorting domain-containing protein [Limisphaerales bacterium]
MADPAFSASTTYTLTYSVTRTDAGSVDITTTFDGSSLNGGTLTQTVTDAGDIYTSFDTFSFRPNAPATTATTFTFSEFKVEYLPVPEPSTFALAGLGLLGLAGALSPRAPVNYLGFFQRVPTLPAPVFTDFK